MRLSSSPLPRRVALALVSLGLLSAGAVSLGLAGCNAGISSAAGGAGGAASGTGTGSNADGAGGAGSATQTSAAQFMTGSTGTGAVTCNAGPDEDKDQDGFTINQGDCNDCDKNVNPGAIEVVVTTPDPVTMMVPPPVDEDCDGTIDNPPPATCDDNLLLDSLNAMDAAKAIELCKLSTGPKSWGLMGAQYVRADGTAFGAQEPAQHGLLASFGTNVMPKAGSRILALSSGRARLPGQTGACTSQTCTSLSGTPPTGFPQDVPGCAGASNINDDVALEVQVKAPTNAVGYSFNFRFTSFEYPEWVCTSYNDQFIALVNPAPMGSLNGNISFDSMHNPVSVNIAFFDVCAAPCALGPTDLVGTGFDNGFGSGGDAGGTAWLETTAPIHGFDEFRIRFAIWDTGDHALDSTAIIDHFQWIANGGTVTVGTTPVPN